MLITTLLRTFLAGRRLKNPKHVTEKYQSQINKFCRKY